MDSRVKRILPIGLLPAALLVGCVPTNLPPITASDAAPWSDQQPLLQRATDIDAEFQDLGLVAHDPAADAYITSVGSRLVPADVAQAITFRYYVLRDPAVNAFALPTGSIYLYAGLLARLENEAQLAYVLAHEMAHVVQRHAVTEERARQYGSLAINAFGFGAFSQTPPFAPVMGPAATHTPMSEYQADTVALAYLHTAGYSIDGARGLFQVLQHVGPAETPARSAYSNDPRNLQRAADVEDDIRGRHLPVQVTGRLGVDAYRPLQMRYARETLELHLDAHHYRLVVDAAQRALQANQQPAWMNYYRGEALRLMAADPVDAANDDSWTSGYTFRRYTVPLFKAESAGYAEDAKQAFLAALSHEPNFAPAHRGLGLLAYRRNDRDAARRELRVYLAQGKDVTDRRYINSLLRHLETP